MSVMFDGDGDAHEVATILHPRGRGRSPAPLSGAAETSLGPPHRVELLVQVVTRRDRPALHLARVRDDPVPLQRVDVVDLLVEEAALELADVLLALLGIGRSSLLLVQLVAC